MRCPPHPRLAHRSLSSRIRFLHARFHFMPPSKVCCCCWRVFAFKLLRSIHACPMTRSAAACPIPGVGASVRAAVSFSVSRGATKKNVCGRCAHTYKQQARSVCLCLSTFEARIGASAPWPWYHINRHPLGKQRVGQTILARVILFGRCMMWMYECSFRLLDCLMISSSFYKKVVRRRSVPGAL